MKAFIAVPDAIVEVVSAQLRGWSALGPFPQADFLVDGGQRAQDSPRWAQLTAGPEVIIPGCRSRGSRGSWGIWCSVWPTRRIFGVSFLAQLFCFSVIFQLLLLLEVGFFLFSSPFGAERRFGSFSWFSLALRGRSMDWGQPGLPTPRQTLGGEEAVQGRFQAGGVKVVLRALTGRCWVAFRDNADALCALASLLCCFSLSVLLQPREEKREVSLKKK